MKNGCRRGSSNNKTNVGWGQEHKGVNPFVMLILLSKEKTSLKYILLVIFVVLYLEMVSLIIFCFVIIVVFLV